MGKKQKGKQESKPKYEIKRHTSFLLNSKSNWTTGLVN